MMKSRSVFAIVFVVLALSTGITLSAADEPTRLVGRWDFDDGTGRDLSGNGNQAQLGGTRIYSLGPGRACIQIQEDDAPLRVPAAEDSPLAIARGTICFWLNAGWNRSTILEYDNGAVQLNQYQGDFQARFSGEDDFRYWSGILDYNWPKPWQTSGKDLTAK